MALYPVKCILFETVKCKNVYDTLSGEIVSCDNSLLFDVIRILSLMKEGKVSEEQLFLDHFSTKGITLYEYRKALKELRLYQKQGIFRKDTHSYQKELRNLNNFLRTMKRDFSRKQVEGSLVLNITHACNLRCQYCPYTAVEYGETRKHEARSMSLELARDRSFEYLDRTRNNKNNLYISFYGGEPLLEFDKIKFLIDLIRKEKKRLRHNARRIFFKVTTNATLLTKDIIGFFVKNRIQLQISLDGPRKIHDKNRIFGDGRGSFKQVMKSMKLLKKISEENGVAGYFDKYVTVNATNFSQTKSEDNAVERFFSRSDIFKNLYFDDEVKFNMAAGKLLKDRCKQKNPQGEVLVKSDIAETNKELKQRVDIAKVHIRKSLDILADLKSSLEDIKIAERFLRAFVDKYRDFFIPDPKHGSKIRALTGTCAIGLRKQFVDIDGKRYMCTQVGLTKESEMGNRTLDFKKISTILKTHVLKFGKPCRSCPAFFFCKECVAQRSQGVRFNFKRDEARCSQFVELVAEQFAFIYSLLDACPSFERFVRKALRKSKL